MNLKERNFRLLITHYLEAYPYVRENPKLADYQKFCRCSLGFADIEPKELPCKRTFNRYIKDYTGTTISGATRINRNVAAINARTQKLEDLLQALLAGEANYEEVEFWFCYHKPLGLRIDDRCIMIEGERLFPLRDSTISTSVVKAFAAGLLYALKK